MFYALLVHLQLLGNQAQKGRTGKQEAEILFAVWQEKTNTKTDIIQKHVIRLLFSTDT
jgi:hypothetical protein